MAPLLIAATLGFLALALSRKSSASTPSTITPKTDSQGDINPQAMAVFASVKADAAKAGIPIKFISGKRSCAEQNELFAQGRTKPGERVTNAEGCKSWHVQGRAVDFTIDRKGAALADYAQVGAIAKAKGCKWGGDFPGFVDMWHLEYHPGLTIEQVCPTGKECLDVKLSLC